VSFTDVMVTVVQAFEVVGVAVLVIGSVWALAHAGVAIWRGEGSTVYVQARQRLGRVILLGLEILIIADIILTITVTPTIESALTLGIIVLVRTLLTFSLEIELEGVLPWRRTKVDG
jgi:uncharacterized membrane protein